MDPNLLKGNLDLILLTILGKGPKYGLQIIEEAKERTHGYFDFKEGSLYPALHRLESLGLVKAEFRPSDRGGPRRRYYQLTHKGSEVFERKREDWTSFVKAIDALREAYGQP